MSTCIQIFFDNPLATYYTGQTITGRMTLHLLKEKKFRGIEINLFGEARVRWTETHTYTSNKKTYTRTEVYSARETHLDHRMVVAGGSSGDVILSPGEYTYFFSLVLPTTIPSSFEGDHGYVRYTVKGKVIRPWRFDHSCKVAFTVLNILDLNALPTLMNPVNITREKYLCCCCCESGPITIVLTVPYTGFVPGQTCQAVVEIDNLSNECVSGQVKLFQNVKFRATTKSRVVEKCIVSERFGEVGVKESKTLSTNLLIPPLPVSYLQYCNIINITYYLQFEGQIGGMHINEKIEVPVVIGSIPLRNMFSSIVPAEGQCSLSPTAPPEYMDTYSEIPPPSYEECMMGKANIRNEEDDDHVQGSAEFAPRYPVYHFKEND